MGFTDTRCNNSAHNSCRAVHEQPVQKSQISGVYNIPDKI